MADDREKLQREYSAVAEGCIECGLCRKDCLFLKKYGIPKQIAQQGLNGQGLRDEVFECSLCSLCTEVCPEDIDPASMFRTMRIAARNAGCGNFRKHRGLLAYERWGSSPLLSWYGLPPGCDTVFFPGCAMLAGRSPRVIQIYEFLRQTIPALGMILDCCTKPSLDLGREEFFLHNFGSMKKFIAAQGVKTILVACPSCYAVWRDYGDEIAVKTMYEYLAETGLPDNRQLTGKVTVHDPCSVRREAGIHQAVRDLVRGMGLELEEMKHRGPKTVCCGEGGAAGYVAPEFADNWTRLRAGEAGENHIITYCAGCTHFLGKRSRVDHVMDLLFEPEATIDGNINVTRSPMTWLKRLMVKTQLPAIVRPAITGRRNRQGEVVSSRKMK